MCWTALSRAQTRSDAILCSMMTSASVTARISVQGLVVGGHYRVTSIDESGVTFEEVKIDHPIVALAGMQQLGSLIVDWDRAQVCRDGTWHLLAPSLFRLFRLLASQPGRTFGHTAIKS